MKESLSTKVRTVIDKLLAKPELVRRLAQELALLAKEANVELTESEKAELLSAIARSATPDSLSLKWPNEQSK